MLDGVSNGTVEMAHTAPYYFFGKDPTFALGCAIPFGLNSRQMTAWMYEGNGLKLMREFYAKVGIMNFPMGNTGAQMGGWYRKEIKSVADLKGLKFRVGGFGGKVMERLGAVPQNIPGGEIYQALEKGTIDAAEWVGPYDDQKLGFNKVAPFYYYPGWWEGGPQLTLYVNPKAYDGLSARYKAIVEWRPPMRTPTCRPSTTCKNPSALKQLVGQGTKVLPFPKDVMAAAFKAAMEVYAEAQRVQPGLEEDLRRLRHLPARCQPVVPFPRSLVRQLHAGPEAVMNRCTGATGNKKPRHWRGFLLRRRSAGPAGRQGFFAWSALSDSCRPFIGSSLSPSAVPACRRSGCCAGLRLRTRHHSPSAAAPCRRRWSGPCWCWWTRCPGRR